MTAVAGVDNGRQQTMDVSCREEMTTGSSTPGCERQREGES